MYKSLLIQEATLVSFLNNTLYSDQTLKLFKAWLTFGVSCSLINLVADILSWRLNKTNIKYVNQCPNNTIYHIGSMTYDDLYYQDFNINFNLDLIQDSVDIFCTNIGVENSQLMFELSCILTHLEKSTWCLIAETILENNGDDHFDNKSLHITVHFNNLIVYLE